MSEGIALWPPDYLRTLDGTVALVPWHDGISSQWESNVRSLDSDHGLVLAFLINRTTVALARCRFADDKLPKRCGALLVTIMADCCLPEGHDGQHLAEAKELVHRTGRHAVVERFAVVPHEQMGTTLNRWRVDLQEHDVQALEDLLQHGEPLQDPSEG